MLSSILKNSQKNGIETTYINGRCAAADEEFNKQNKLVVFEQSYGSIYDAETAVFKTSVDYDAPAKIYHLRHVDVLVMEGYALFVHTEEPTAAVFKLSKVRNNVLTDYQFVAASIFGLDDVRPFAIENAGKFSIDSNDEWEDYLCAMTACGLIDAENVEILTTNTVSAF